MQCMLKILRASDKIAIAFGHRQDFLQDLRDKLLKHQNDAEKVKNCMDLLLVITNKHSKPRNMLCENEFYPVIVKILHSSRDEDLVVLEEIATMLLSLYSGKLKD